MPFRKGDKVETTMNSEGTIVEADPARDKYAVKDDDNPRQKPIVYSGKELKKKN